MPAFTLIQLREAVRTKGDYPSSAVMTDAFVTQAINEALAELVELVSDQFQGYYDTTSTVVTVAGTQTVNLPSTMLNLRALDRQIATDRHTPLSRISLTQSYAYQGRGAPRAYTLHGGTAPGTIRLFPVPDAVYTLRVTFESLFTALSADGDSFDFRNGWEEYVHQAALLRLDAREERPLGDRMALIERAKERIIRSASKRNSAEPEYLTSWPEPVLVDEVL